MKTLLIALSLLSFSGAFASYEDHETVQELAASGEYHLEASESCVEEQLLLGSDCVKVFDLPGHVAREVENMKINELENESDYDQRITSLLHFKSQKISQDYVSVKSVVDLFSGLNVEVNDLEAIAFESEIVDRRSFERFDELFVDLFYKVDSNTQKFIRNSFMGKMIDIISYEEGVELYPGGGFYVTHYLIVSAQEVMYVKRAWWNS